MTRYIRAGLRTVATRPAQAGFPETFSRSCEASAGRRTLSERRGS